MAVVEINTITFVENLLSLQKVYMLTKLQCTTNMYVKNNKL